MSSNASYPVAGTEDASYPFWSPDGEFIGFFAGGKLKKISSAGGPTQIITDAASGRGGTWNKEGVILFAPTILSAIFRVPAGGGAPVAVTFPSGDEGVRHRWPSFLPDGNHFLFTGAKDLHLGSLDSRETRTLIPDASNAQFVPPDRLVFSRGEVLMTQKFDSGKLMLSGDPAPLPFGSVSHWTPKQFSIFSAAPDGTLAFLPAMSPVSQLIWIDRTGHEVGVVGEAGQYLDAALSPDGKKIAIVKGSTRDGDIWLVDVADGRWSRFTFRPGHYGELTWSNDASMLAFFFVPGAVGQTYIKSLNRDAEATLVVQTKEWTVPHAFSPDGRYLLLGRQMAATGFDIFSVTLDGKGTLKPILQTPFAEARARFSPDGKLFAYDSNESGRGEVYVRRFPPTADQWQVSVSGGVSPLWRADGRELYYFGSENVMAVPINVAERLNPGTPFPLFHAPSRLMAASLSAAGPIGMIIPGVTPSGDKFLLRSNADQNRASLNVVLHWQSTLREQGK
jgi:Tol biopolymer transport system component